MIERLLVLLWAFGAIVFAMFLTTDHPWEPTDPTWLMFPVTVAMILFWPLVLLVSTPPFRWLGKKAGLDR